jgi:aspartate/methionine/tyrosine aminotransferase
MLLPVQLAAAEALKNRKSWYQEINKTYSRRRKVAEGIMKIMKCTWDHDQTGLFLWGRIPEDSDSKSLTDKLLNKTHVFITPGFIFGNNGEGYVRISLCCKEEILMMAKERILKLYNS